jgi:Arc/MetJ-type ribon-helix-helix transcriptional regulator
MECLWFAERSEVWMKTITVDLPERLSAELGRLVKEGWFADESEIVRMALWEFVHRNRFALTEEFQREDIGWALQATVSTASGLLATNQPAPNDEEITRWLAEHRSEKYG